MPKLSLFKRYFDLLKLITFVSSYYATLRQMIKVPIIEPMKTFTIYSVPKAFPPIPVRYYTFHKLVTKLGKVVEFLNTKHPGLLDQTLKIYI